MDEGESGLYDETTVRSWAGEQFSSQQFRPLAHAAQSVADAVGMGRRGTVAADLQPKGVFFRT